MKSESGTCGQTGAPGSGDARRDIPILMYHDVVAGPATPAPFAVTLREFEAQLDALQRGGWRGVRFQELREMMAGRAAWDRRCVWITFDDGYASFLELAMPALRARGMAATVFAVAGEMGGFNRWDAPRGFPRRKLLGEAGLRAVLDAGMEIGSHGWAHRNLTTCSAVELDEELIRSRETLRERLGADIAVFSYPYGRYLPAHFAGLAQAGYEAAVSDRSGERSVTNNRFAMRRVVIESGQGRLRFSLRLTRFYFRYRGWRRS